MNSPHLLVYYGPQDETSVGVAANPVQDKQVGVSLGEILPLLVDAVGSRRTWLRDFADEEVSISMDLYEVLLAYKHYRRPSA
jgi:hypothetical protein